MYAVFVGDAWCVPHIECVLYIVCILLQLICTGLYRILPTQCVVNNPGSYWHYRQSSGWCFQALHRVYCVVCCLFIIFVECLLCYVLWVLYGVHWARLYSVMCICVQFWVCTTAITMCYVLFCYATLLPAQYAMYVLFVLHYCQYRVLCISYLCSHHLPVQGAMYLLLRVALLPVWCAMYVLFVLHYCQCSVPLLNTASTVCRCWTLQAQCGSCWTLQAQCAAVQHCKRSVPLFNTASAVCRCWTLPAQCSAVEHCQRSVPLLNTASTVSRVGAMISPLFLFILNYFYSFSRIGNGWVWGFSTITASNLIFPAMYLDKRKSQGLQSNIPRLSFFSSHPCIHCCTHIIKAIPLD